MKRIAILTMTFNNNYGGYLQAYALMEVIKSLGCNPELVNVKLPKKNYFRLLFVILKRLIIKILIDKNRYSGFLPDWYYIWKEPSLEREITKFPIKYIQPRSLSIYKNKDFKKLNKYDAYVVGSDQVWRPKMYRFISRAFFDFVDDNNAKKISYAASFGVDHWEFTDKDTQKYRAQIQKFNAVSVRESSGIDLCKNYLNIDSTLVLDPTMLLNSSDYRKIIKDEGADKEIGLLAVYVLDMTDDKKKLIEFVSDRLGVKPCFMGREDVSDQYPSVPSWLNAFDKAEYIITDSFHGCVFSIIFRKKFLAYVNKERGAARFESLLSQFQLNDYLVSSFDEDKCSVIFEGKFHYDENLISKRISESYSFLEKSIA